MRDANPESEIRIWEDISDAVDEGVKELQQSRTQVFKMVIGISVGAVSTAEVEKNPTLTTMAKIYVAIKNRR